MKYFCISDIHSFATEMKAALKQAGFNSRNKEHTLIICGDIFDRGFETIKVYKFITSIPKSRRILIRGNHEQLYFNLLEKDFPESFDFTNGTVETFCQIAQIPSDLLNEDTYQYNEQLYKVGSRSAWEDIKNIVREHEVTKWLKSPEWKNYFELDKFIFVHSFIPVKSLDSLPAYYINNRKQEYLSTWREADNTAWEDASWGCPWKQYQAGLFKPEEDAGKTLVCGHWHTSDFFRHLKFIHTYMCECAPVYFSKGIIGLDGGCQYNFFHGIYIHPQNVMIIDEDLNCYDQFGCKLEEPEEFKQRIIRTVTIDKDGNKLSGSDDFLEE